MKSAQTYFNKSSLILAFSFASSGFARDNGFRVVPGLSEAACYLNSTDIVSYIDEGTQSTRDFLAGDVRCSNWAWSYGVGSFKDSYISRSRCAKAGVFNGRTRNDSLFALPDGSSECVTASANVQSRILNGPTGRFHTVDVKGGTLTDLRFENVLWDGVTLNNVRMDRTSFNQSRIAKTVMNKVTASKLNFSRSRVELSIGDHKGFPVYNLQLTNQSNIGEISMINSSVKLNMAGTNIRSLDLYGAGNTPAAEGANLPSSVILKFLNFSRNRANVAIGLGNARLAALQIIGLTSYNSFWAQDLQVPNPDFLGVILTGANFRNAQIPEADFRAFHTFGVSNAGWTYGPYFLTHIDWANFSGADLTRAVFAGMKGGDTRIRMEASQSKFHGANLRGALFDYANFQWAHFGPAEGLPGADLSDACFNDVVLLGSDLERAASLRGSHYTSLTQLPFSAARAAELGMSLGDCPNLSTATW